MNRRDFLQAVSVASATTVAPWAFAGDNVSRVAAFDAGAAKYPWLAAMKGAKTDFAPSTLKIVSGKLPAALKGRFYRNGPALFERGGERYGHWFDGDGMVQQFAFTGETVAHRGRFVRTEKFEAEAQANQFLVSAFGTHIKQGRAVRGPDSFNTANTNAIEHAGRVLAMWEGGSAVSLDPKDLSTQGAVTWKENWTQMPFSAHPKLAPDGTLWNMGSFGKGLVTYHIGADGKLVKAQTIQLPFLGGMVHDMAITDRYIVIPVPPVKLDFNAIARGEGTETAFGWNAKEPLRIVVLDKDDLSKRKVFELPNEMVFHVGNAYESSDGEIILNYIGSSGRDFLSGSAVEIMRGEPRSNGTGAASEMVTAVINMKTGRVERGALGDMTEFPRVDPRFIGKPSRYSVAPVGQKQFATRPDFWFHAVAIRDHKTGKLSTYDYGEYAVVEEHIIVPKPGTTAELDAWVIGTTFDAKAKRTRVNVFEANAIADGPIAVAEMNTFIPLGFHGNFTAI